jgi:hypothetical protein
MKLILAVLLLQTVTPTGCAELQPLHGVHLEIPINRGPEPLAPNTDGPVPQKVQPNAPAPPLPTQQPGPPPQ